MLVSRKPHKIKGFPKCKRKHSFSGLFIFYLPRPGLFLFPKNFFKKFQKKVCRFSKKSSTGTEKGFFLGHLENRISIHQIPSLYQEPEMQARGDFLLFRKERSRPMHGKPDCHRWRPWTVQGTMILLYGATGEPGGGGIPMRMVGSHPSDDLPCVRGSGKNSTHDQSIQSIWYFVCSGGSNDSNL